MTEAYECNTLLEKWRNPKGWKAVAVILFTALFIASVAGLVYVTGGTAFGWLNLMYIPIILAAASYRMLGGFATALAGGLAVGPFMPLHVNDFSTRFTCFASFLLIAPNSRKRK